MGAARLYIDGRFTDGTGGGRLDVVNPATEEVFASAPEGSPADVEAAVLAARNAFDNGPWGRTSAADRQAALRRYLAALVARTDELVDLTIAEAGAVRTVAQGVHIGASLAHFTDMVERVLPTFEFQTAQLPTFGKGIGGGVVRREAAGVVAAITPFNYPFFVSLMKVGAALAAGCTVVLKPSPFTPLEVLIMGDAAADAELPPGVLNVITADLEGSQLLTSHPAVDVVSFTGSEAVGAQILEQSAPTIKKVVLELGGKSANIVCADADLALAVPQSAVTFTRQTGQACAAQSRILVEASIHDELVGRLVERLGQIKIGDPNDPAMEVGPLIRESQRARVERFVQIGRDEGATVAFGGGRPAGLDKGYYVEPTLFVDVKNSMQIAQEEIFGPVAAVIPFHDDDEAVAIANDSRYGLGGAVWSGDAKRAFDIAARVRTGTITINGGGGGVNAHGPFGGYKRSGIGREFGEAGLAEFLETKTVNWGVR